jgi:hypothetical protein
MYVLVNFWRVFACGMCCSWGRLEPARVRVWACFAPYRVLRRHQLGRFRISFRPRRTPPESCSCMYLTFVGVYLRVSCAVLGVARCPRVSDFGRRVEFRCCHRHLFLAIRFARAARRPNQVEVCIGQF